MERTAVCALSCPYGENYRSSSDFRWIAASNGADLAGVGREGHFRFSLLLLPPARRERGARNRLPERPQLPGLPRCRPRSVPGQPRPGAKPCPGKRCLPRPVRCSSSSPGSGNSSPALTPSAGCWRELAAAKGSAEQRSVSPEPPLPTLLTFAGALAAERAGRAMSDLRYPRGKAGQAKRGKAAPLPRYSLICALHRGEVF